MKTIKPCAFGPRHKWEWVKNITISSHAGGGCLRLSSKGRYKCQCGAIKIGDANHNEAIPLTLMVSGNQATEGRD